MEQASGFARWKQGLKKTRDNLFLRIFSSRECVDEDFFEELEEALILADTGMGTAQRLIGGLQDALKEARVIERTRARELMISRIADAVRPETEFLPQGERAVVLIVGVNGVGKTTSIGKLAHRYRQEGRGVMLAAADTFRAAAAEQLTQWAQRAGVPIVKHGEGADPSAVVFDAIASYKAKKADLLIVDTAGRLHNKQNLMNELAKMRRVIQRELPDTRCETLLVLDAATGQNAVAQARAFQEVSELTGVILTKLDGTAKGGVVIAVAEELHVPVRFIGVGEGIDDLMPFQPESFSKALFTAE